MTLDDLRAQLRSALERAERAVEMADREARVASEAAPDESADDAIGGPSSRTDAEAGYPRSSWLV